jgi:hypothetical protein
MNMFESFQNSTPINNVSMLNIGRNENIAKMEIATLAVLLYLPYKWRL